MLVIRFTLSRCGRFHSPSFNSLFGTRLCAFIFLQHVPFEELGNIQPWLAQHKTDVHYCRLYTNDPLPDVNETDLLIVLGGPMSVNDESCITLGWWRKKAFLAQAIAAEKPIVGICLGAQLIASCQGRGFTQLC